MRTQVVQPYYGVDKVECWLPYSRTEVPIRVPDENLLGIIEAKQVPAAPDAVSEITHALNNPLGDMKIEVLAKPGQKACIVVDDKTRPTPSHLMVQPLLERLNQAGVRDEDITILFGCGTHLTMTPDEAPILIGEDCAKRVRILLHDAERQDLVYVGETSRGTKVRVNKVFAEADIKILTGDVELHYYAGYGGGRKSILPAITDSGSTQHNHSFMFDPLSKTGNIEGNPVHLDMVEAAHLVKPDFALNVVLNPQNSIVKAFAGDMDRVFEEGVRIVDDMYKVPVDSSADIVAVSPGGYPTDINLYQAHKALDSALGIVKDGGVIILVAECPEGHGHKVFYDWMAKFKTASDMKKEIRRHFVLGAHKAYYLADALDRVRIILVSTMPDYYASKVFRLRTAKTANVAMNMAFRMLNKKAKVLLLPHGATTLPVLVRKKEGEVA
jgi:nickel-dependent lactate racemase